MKGNFSDLMSKKKTKEVPANLDDMLATAKIQTKQKPKPKTGGLDLDPNARRGKRYKTPEGEVVKLDGKVQEIPLNAYEVQLLERAANQSGLTLTAYIRSLAINDARKRTDVD